MLYDNFDCGMQGADNDVRLSDVHVAPLGKSLLLIHSTITAPTDVS